MMRAVWIACCTDEGGALVYDEILKRDPTAQVLRVCDVDTLRSMVAAFTQVAGVIIRLHGLPFLDVERSVEEISRVAHVGRVVIMVDAAALSGSARLFQAGAAEVVAEHATAPAAARVNRTDAERVIPASCTHLGHDDASGRQRAFVEAGSETHPGGNAEPPGWARAEATAEPVEEEAWSSQSTRAAAEEPYREAREEVDGRQVPPEASRKLEQALPFNPYVPQQKVEEPAPSSSAPATRSASDFGEAAYAQSSWQPLVSREAQPAGGAPIITVLSGRGGCGATTIIACMAYLAAEQGLRTAVVDLDLMVGNLYDVMGVEHLSDLGQLLTAAQTGRLDEDDLMRTAMRIGPNMTLWGPLALPEQAESMGPAVELLLGTLRSEADVVLVDTATSWSDAVAAAVAMSDRCLMIGSSAPSTVTSLTRIMELAARIGVPRTRMTSVFNRLGAPGCGEDDAMRFEVSVALGSRARVADGGNDVRELMSFGNTAALLDRPGPFSASLKALTRDVLLELGCSVGEMPASEPADPHTRLRLPWHKVDGGAS